ncbi:MAG TPA: AmmeMemoRadiSam system protein B [Candidatus Binatia bacterium]|nr:AmmeMemoRadiSam system protein B [Candidatus Binatia bacterium]
MQDRPRLRAVEAFPVQHDGKTLIYLKDPLNLATPLGVSPVGYFIMSHFDGQHSFIDIQEAYCRQFGALLLTDELRDLVAMLDRHYYLITDRFLDYQRSVAEEFRRVPTRAPAHMGGVYKQDPEELRTQLDGYFLSAGGPGMPRYEERASAPRAIVAPHIDFHRGGPAYAWAYKHLAESDGVDLYILLGTSHCGGANPFILTLKDFETPLGIVETDRGFVESLQAKCGEDLFADEYLHRGEHSLEFQVIFLKHISRQRARITGRDEKPFKIVPILVSSFHPMVMSETLPEQISPVQSFLRALRELTEKETRSVCLVAGVDLAHIGRQFGDREPITEDFLKWVEAEDRKLVDRLAALDGPGFFKEIAKDRDRRRICGFSPLYTLIHLLDGAPGKNLKYSQAFTPETASAVTFTSMIFK